MTDLILYTHPMSRGRIARWMLEETGAAYTTSIVPFHEMKGTEYRTINPMGKVPALKHKQHIITETAAICVYLADTFPDAKLSPTADERADYYRWLFFGAGPVEAAISNHAIGFNPTEEQSRFVGYGSYETVMDVLDQTLSTKPYITGSRFTAADVYIGAQINFGLGFKTIDARPSFLAYSERLKERAALQRATALDEADMAKIKT
jgi:glutathione S-transferase